MRVLILSGGLGIRSSCFKLFIQILGKSLIELYKERFKDFEIHVNVNKRDSDKLKNIKDVTLEIEEKRMGNAQPIRDFALKYKEDFICIHNDIFTILDFNKFVKQIQEKDKQFTAILLSKNIGRPKAFGILTFDKDKKVKSLTRSRYVNGAIYYFKKEIANYIEENKYQDLDKDVFQKLISEEKLGVYTFSGVWFDVGSDLKAGIINQKLKDRKFLENKK